MVSLDYRLNPIYTIKECSSSGALYNKSCGCSKGGFVDKFVRDPNKTPDSSQRPPHNCPKCGNPVEDFLNTSESSNDNTNVVNAPQQPFVFNQDPGENSSQSPPHIDHHCCYGCGDSSNGIFCQRCTCEYCGKDAHYGYNCLPKVPIISNLEPGYNQNVDEFPQTLPSFHPTYYSRDENSFTYDSNLNFVDDSPNPPPQPPTYSHEFCGNDAHYGHDCPPQVPFIYNPEPCYNQDFNFPQNFQKQVVNLDTYTPEPSQYRKIPICYDDDDDEYSFATQEYLKKFSSAITPDLPKSDSLIMEDKHLDTIPEMESDELIKSSVEDLVHTPSESDGISESECDLPVCDDSSPKKDEVLDDIISIPPGNGNDHFNAESSLIESVLNRDNVISSPKIDFLLEEFAGELALIAPIPPGIVEADFDPKGDIRFIENLMYDNSFPRPPETLKDDSETVIDSNNDYSSSDDDSPYSEDIDYVDALPPDPELVSLEVVGNVVQEDGEIDTDILLTIKDDILREKLLKKDSHIVIDTLLLFSSENEDKVVNPGILAAGEEKSPHLLSYRGFKAFQLISESPMMIFGGDIPILDVLFLYFYPP
ncbi:hypothetical protein Tco_1501676 [Tanacetum coccineum]